MIDPTYLPAVIRLLQNGQTPVFVANSFGLDLADVDGLGIERITPPMDPDELVAGISAYTRRALEEGMQMLNNATPAIKVRLIGGALGQALRMMGQTAPKELDELRDEMSELFTQVGTDSRDPNSIYAPYADDDPTAYNPDVDRPA